jgi:hypothetical protein
VCWDVREFSKRMLSTPHVQAVRRISDVIDWSGGLIDET